MINQDDLSQEDLDELRTRSALRIGSLCVAIGVVLVVAFLLVGFIATFWSSLLQGTLAQVGIQIAAVDEVTQFLGDVSPYVWALVFGLSGIGVLIFVITIIGRLLSAIRRRAMGAKSNGDSKRYRNPKYKHETITGVARNVRVYDQPTSSTSNSEGSTTSSTTISTTNYMTWIAFRLEVVDQIGNITGYRPIDLCLDQEDASSSLIADGDQISALYVTTRAGLESKLSQLRNISLNKVIYSDGSLDDEDASLLLSTGFSSQHIDYLKRTFLNDPGSLIEPPILYKAAFGRPDLRFVRVRSVTDSWLDDLSPNVHLSTLVTDMLAGLNSVASSLVYIVMGETSSVTIYIGLELLKNNEIIPRDDPRNPEVEAMAQNETIVSPDDVPLSQDPTLALDTFDNTDSEQPTSAHEDQIPNSEVTSPGTSTDQDGDDNGGADSLSVLIGALQSTYPGVRVEELSTDEIARLQTTLAGLNCGALVTGTPAATSQMDAESFSALGRMIDSMFGTQWAYVLVASSVSPQEQIQLRDAILAEMLDINNSERSRNAPHPIARAYLELLQRFQEKTTLGDAIGLWHVSDYVLAHSKGTLVRASTLVKSVLSGSALQLDPIRILPDPKFTDYAANFMIVDSAAPDAPGRVRYPHRYASLLTSEELSSFVHLPTHELPGYAVIDDAKFDTDPPPLRGQEGITLGEVVDRGRPLGVCYTTNVHRLVRHMLVAGPTGKGKTNTMLHTLTEVCKHRIPFLVIEPSKTEYRCLLDYPEVAQDLRIFTLADKTSPLHLNPFQILPGVPVQTHIDYLKSVFNASFVMYAPMPYVMERCLIEIYEDKGWNLATGGNDRGVHPNAFPNLTDLYQKIEPVVSSLGYEQRITQDVIGALQTRIQTLRTGGKGLMLDTRLSTSFEELFGHPTILEMDRLADPADKAFIIGLLFIFLNEHRVRQGSTHGERLRHLAVIEEAHRLLSHVPPALQYETANVKGMAVEAFCNMLIEARSYGQGFAIVEQMPSKLSPDVLKNTGLKIALGFVSVEERSTIAGSMNLSARQVNRLASLPLGQAVVYGEELDGPMLIAVPHCSFISGLGREQERQSEDQRVREHMNTKGRDAEKILSVNRFRADIAPVIDSDEFQETLARYILSTVLDQNALISGFQEVLQSISKFSPRGIYHPELITQTLAHGIDQYFEMRSRQYNWSYQTAEHLHKTFLDLFNTITIPRINNTTSGAELSPEELDRVHTFQKSYVEHCQVPFYPFAGCHKVCPNTTCLYRYNVVPFLRNLRLESKIMEVLEKLDEPQRSRRLADLISIPARRTLREETPREERRKAALCFMIQKSEGIQSFDYVHRRVIMDGLIGISDAGTDADKSATTNENK